MRAFRFSILRFGGTTLVSTVCYNTIDGTAMAPVDYITLVAGPANCVTFAPGDTSRDVVVLVNGDPIPEPNETFFLHLISATSGTVSTTDGVGTILNDDVGGPPPPPPGGNLEGDVNRTALGVPGNGDGFVDVRDGAQFDRFANGLDSPQTTPNEFQRFDDGPLATLGNGTITSSDRTQLDRYSAGLDPLTAAGGPTNPVTVICTASSRPETVAELESEDVADARVIHLISVSGNAGTDVTVYVESDAQGNEVATQYSLNFDPAVLAISDMSGSNPNVKLGSGAPAGTTLTVNASQVAAGHIGIVENFNGAGDGAVTAGTKRIAAVMFHILPSAAFGATPITFDDGVIAKVTSDTNGIGLGTTYDQKGVVSVLHTGAIGVSLAGRVMTPDGRGMRNATVTMTDQNGVTLTVTTSAFGHYSFDNLAVGETYTIAAASRRYRFASRLVSVTDDLADLDLTAEP